jgi:hypothetical protein
MSKCNCPICHRECDTEDTVIIDIVTKSQHLNTKIRGRKVVRTYIDTHFYVRECKRCASLQKWIRYIININLNTNNLPSYKTHNAPQSKMDC